jgi:hypothetical protein
VQAVKRAALTLSIHMQVLPAHLHGQQTEAHKGNEETWKRAHSRNGTCRAFF